jgi:hypothetical protein
MSIERYQYIASKRVMHADMPGVRWRYIEAPPALASSLLGCPVSRHEHGVIETDRFLLESMREAAGLTPLQPLLRRV